MKTLSLLIFFLSFSCCHESLSPKIELIEPYSEELELKEPFPDKPFGQVFEKKDFKLTYIGSHHSNNRNSKTFELIEKALKESGAKLIIVEGFEHKHGLNPKAYLKSFQETSTETFYKHGETAFASLEATKKGIPFTGGEPDEKDLLKAVLKEGYSTLDLMFFYSLRQIPQLKRQKELGEKPLEELFIRYIKYNRSKLGYDKNFNPEFTEFKAWYKKRNKKEFSLKNFNAEEVSPLLSGEFYTQRIAGRVSLERDKFIVKVIAESLEKYKNVMITYGKSHLSSQRPALEELLGKPRKTFH